MPKQTAYPTENFLFRTTFARVLASVNAMCQATRNRRFAPGFHFVSLLQYSAAIGTTTFAGGNCSMRAEVMV